MLSAVGVLPLSGALPGLRGFEDAVHHWQSRHGAAEYARYASSDTAAIADNILHWQRTNGGWKENEDPARILSPEEWEDVEAERDTLDTSFDNRNIWPQVSFLAAAYQLTGDERYREGCLRGLAYIFTGQDPSGGWPHSYPAKGYRAHLTFADDIIPDQLRLLRAVAAGIAPFEWIPGTIRERANEAVQRGDQFILQVQVRIAGVPTVWAGQYAVGSLRPVGGRSFELPGLLGSESASVIRYLMSIEDPGPEIVRAIENGVAWYERNKILGWRLEKFPIPAEQFAYHQARHDVRLVEDPDAPPLWARFYDLETSKPFLANRDGKKVFSLDEVELERRTGYSWYGGWGNGLLEKDYPAWRASLR